MTTRRQRSSPALSRRGRSAAAARRPAGRTSAGSTGRTRGCPSCRGRRRASRRSRAAWSNDVVVVELARDEADALQQLVPDVVVGTRVRACCLDGVVDDLLEVLVLPVAPREPDEGEARGQQTAVGEVVDGRHELLARQVAGDTEDHEARSGPAIRLRRRSSGIAQRIVPARDLNGHGGSWMLLLRGFEERRALRPARIGERERQRPGVRGSASTLASPAAWAWMS